MESIEKSRSNLVESSLRDDIAQYLKFWPWFVLGVIITVSISFIYLRYATPIYQTQASILIKDEKNSELSELAAFQDLGLTGTLNQSGFENEIQILKSKSLTERVVKELDLNVTYISEGNVRDSEMFDEVPFKVTVITSSDSLEFPLEPFYIEPISELKFQAWEADGEKQEYFFGDNISLSFGEFSVTLNMDHVLDTQKLSPVKVVVNSVPATIAEYRQKIKVEQLTDFSSVLLLSIEASNINKSEAILNELIKQYNQDAIDDRNIVSRNSLILLRLERLSLKNQII